jgi:hypothetical protein
LNPILSLLGIDVIYCNPFIDEKWNGAMDQFDQSISPLEEQVASKLRSHLSQVGTHSLQVSLIYKRRFEDLIFNTFYFVI